MTLKNQCYVFVIVFAIALFSNFSFGQKEKLPIRELENQHVFLLSNLENVQSNSPLFSNIKNLITKQEGNSTILFLGDIISKNGIDKTPNKEEVNKIQNILDLAATAEQSIFVPGDKEWDDGGKEGFRKVKSLEKHFKKEKIQITPSDGCLGPEVVDVGDFLRIITINTQWWVHRYQKPESEDLDCPAFNEVEFWDELESAMNDAEDRNVILAAHHPILSFGQYAGYGLTRQHFSPPIIGSFIAGYHQSVGTKKDLTQAALVNFSNELLKRLERFPPIIYASGHEYDLQLNYKSGSYHLNSGAIHQAKKTSKNRYSKFRQSKPGVAHLEFSKDGEVSMKIWDVQSDGSLKNNHDQILFQSPCNLPLIESSLPINKKYNPCSEVENKSLVEIPFSGKAIADSQFDAGKTKQFFMGKHYRTSWGKELDNIPYLNLDTLYGGLTPTEKGGGAQTVSLKFKSDDGRVFAFRSVVKDPNKKLDRELRKTIYGDVMEDFTAHQHPYGSLVVSVFMDELGLPHSQPKLFLMPDHPKLGKYRKEFAGKLGFLEIKPKKKKKGRKGFQNADKVSSTFQMYRKLLGDNDNVFDSDKYVMARLLDMWISDWDRHQDNWKWLGYDNGKGITYTPFPKDRDKAFSLFQGLYQLLDWELFVKDRGRFRESYRSVKSLNFKARNMDRLLARDYDLQKWMEATDKFTNLMTDEVIEKALLGLPPEVYDLSALEISRLLKIRRATLKNAVKDYYKLLAKKVTIIGTNKQEIFEVFRQEDNDVDVRVFKRKKKGKRGQLLFKRTFLAKETKEINLYGLAKDDEFYLAGKSSSSIKVRIIGGDGKDFIVDKSKVEDRNSRTLIYDFNKKDTVVMGATTQLKSQNREIHFAAEDFYEDDYAYLIPMGSYNVDDGWGFGFATGKSWQQFGKPNFGAKYALVVLASTQKNYSINLSTQFREVIKKWDLVFNLKAARPDRNFRFFYGLGNDTEFDRTRFRDNYYTNLTTNFSSELGLLKTFWKKSQLKISGKYEFQKIEISSRNKLDASIYEDENPAGFGESILFGPEVDFNLDLRDNVAFPTKGAQLKVQNFSFFNTKNDSEFGGRVSTEALFYFSTGIKIPTTLGVRAGYMKTYGDTPFFYKSYLGQQANLRGFRNNRYGGTSAAFVNTDLRFHFGTILTKVLPLRYGVYGLFDTGRVWVDGEDSDSIHFAYGGGFYLIPYVESFNLNLSIAKPNQGKVLFNFRIGFFVR
ncbi:MAG: hypothetical protein AB8H03_20600 [Saprospiraceae bacterium]